MNTATKWKYNAKKLRGWWRLLFGFCPACNFRCTRIVRLQGLPVGIEQVKAINPQSKFGGKDLLHN